LSSSPTGPAHKVYQAVGEAPPVLPCSRFNSLY
jgi:hypothetical protein